MAEHTGNIHPREGHFWRHLNGQHHAQRRQWIEQALTQQGFQVVPQKGGIQMVIELAGNDVTFVHKANAAGLAVQHTGKGLGFLLVRTEDYCFVLRISLAKYGARGSTAIAQCFKLITPKPGLVDKTRSAALMRYVSGGAVRGRCHALSNFFQSDYCLSSHYDLRMLKRHPRNTYPTARTHATPGSFTNKVIRAANGIACGLLDASTTMHSRPGFFQQRPPALLRAASASPFGVAAP